MPEELGVGVKVRVGWGVLVTVVVGGGVVVGSAVAVGNASVAIAL